MDRSRRTESLKEIDVLGEAEENQLTKSIDKSAVGKLKSVTPSALELAFSFLNKGILDTDAYYKVRWRLYEEDDSNN
jgi:hypothetical protein